MICPLVDLYDLTNYTHFAATWAMFGVIWFVQLIHYPLLGKVGADSFVAFEKELLNRTSFVVIPLMVTEIAAAGILAILNWGSELSLLSVINLVSVALIWVSTFFIQVPLHNKLSDGFDSVAHQKLVLTNWIRTILWTIRGGLAVNLIWAN